MRYTVKITFKGWDVKPLIANEKTKIKAEEWLELMDHSVYTIEITDSVTGNVTVLT